jgi:hypothetical protein
LDVVSPNHGLTPFARQLVCAILTAVIAIPPASVAVLAEGRANAALATLSVTSDPVAADVFIDGQFVGRTPMSIDSLAPGDHRVRLAKDGYLENARIVSVSTGQPRAVEVKLTKTSNADAEAAQVTGGGGGGGGSKKWLWIGIAGGAAAGVAAYTLTKNSPPKPGTISVSPTGTGMAGQTTFTLTSSASDPDGDSLTYSWNFGDGSTGTGASPTHLYAAAGTFNVTLSVSDGKKSASAPGSTVTVGQNITATWTGGRENQFGCAINWVLTQSGTNLTGSMVFVAPCTGTVTGVTGTVSGLTHPATVTVISPSYSFTSGTSTFPGLTMQFSGTTVAPGASMAGNLRLRQTPGTFDQSYAATYTR